VERFALLRYTLVRLAIFAVVTGLLWLIGVRTNTLLLIALGLVISGFISLVVLNRSRDAASASVVGVFSRINARIDASTRAEDVDEGTEDDIAAGDSPETRKDGE